MVFRLSNLGGKFGGFFIGLKEHIKHKRKNQSGGDKSNDIEVTGEGAAKLVYHEGDCISKSALITDCEPSPFCAVHFALHSADCREAGRAKKVEHKEGIAGDSGINLQQNGLALLIKRQPIPYCWCPLKVDHQINQGSVEISWEL